MSVTPVQSYAVLMQLKAAQTENKRNNYDMTELECTQWVLVGTTHFLRHRLMNGFYWVLLGSLCI